jgi:hypothetical protein
VRTFLPHEAPFCESRPAYQAEALPIVALERPDLARKSPFARLGPESQRYAETDRSPLAPLGKTAQNGSEVSIDVSIMRDHTRPQGFIALR